MPHFGQFPQTRLRRLRRQPCLRELARETHLTCTDLVLPLFIRHGSQIKNAIASMPGHYQFSVDNLQQEITAITDLGINKVILFGIPAKKDALGKESYSDQGIIQTALKVIKQTAPHLLVLTDVCFCEYTDHGHCGVIHADSDDIDNDQTLDLLAKQAVSLASHGADVIAPSGMIDGMVKHLRQALDQAGFSHLPILSYAVKYASSFYGPFRDAAEGAPRFGDRRKYQMDNANAQEALRECALDIAEGTDMLMVKPAHTYLDIIYRVKQAYPALPLGAYHTSGEFAMLKAAAEKGWVNEKEAVIEVLTAIKRAGANFIITYYTKEVCAWLAEKK